MPSALSCLPEIFANLLVILCLTRTGYGWLPDLSSKLVNSINRIPSISFKSNASLPDHFTVLYQDDNSILLGGREKVYNLSVFDFNERKDSSIYWASSEAHSQLCNLKGKAEEDCQNYIRILFQTTPGKFLICGTNSYKPLCRILRRQNDKMIVEKEMEGTGLCPYDPEHNSTAVYSSGHLFSATVADFSGTDSLIYREPLRTELSDLRQLNAPNFISSLTYGDYIYFFFRETAVEYMNCGKVIYSRVARVCKHDKGGPHQSSGRWTTFLKARLNCSIPGEYPFYFDEIQSTSDIVEGRYGEDRAEKIIYTVHTTPTNSIGGSALCIFTMASIQDVFGGAFKHQESINSNWLPLSESVVPNPRPGECVPDSRVLADRNVNFIKTHPMMEEAVGAMHGRPVLVRVSLHYRFTAVAVDGQVRTIDDETYDVVYIGTDNGKVLKMVNIPGINSTKAHVISENEVFSINTPIRQLKTAPGYGRVIAVTKDEVKLITLNHCETIHHCNECMELRDPHCAWDLMKSACVSLDAVTSFRYLVQDVKNGNILKCKNSPTNDNEVSVVKHERKEFADDPLEDDGFVDELKSKEAAEEERKECGDLGRVASDYLHMIVGGAIVGGLVFGFVCGYLVSRRFHAHPNAPSFIEQRNHLDRLNVNQNSFLTPRPKTVNLDVLNVSAETLPPKKDNLDSLKNLNITNEGTLQKIKKTYI
ncbi:unnamed protein product [Phaedon cochleariae]|uniref:Sema domain-containing protein n=1 Tax=Phaedon cochleariae TaxID=80249 RepID=A0A9P0DGM6_PHACE|nr:unnamed protein product [Phaedon cochleariae]